MESILQVNHVFAIILIGGLIWLLCWLFKTFTINHKKNGTYLFGPTRKDNPEIQFDLDLLTDGDDNEALLTSDESNV